MTKNIYLSVFGTFGTPHGFRQSTIKGYKGLDSFDLETTAIKLFPSTKKVYALRKEKVGRDNVISYMIYSYASEESSTRGGTFVGVAITEVNGIGDINKTLECLEDFHGKSMTNPKNVQNGIIRVKHSDEFELFQPKGYNGLEVLSDGIEDIDFAKQGKKLVIYTSLKNIKDLYEKGLELLNSYDVLYFTDDQEVANYVSKQRLFAFIQEVEGHREFFQEVENVIRMKREKQNKEGNRILEKIQELKKHKEDWREKCRKLEQENQKILAENKEIEKNKSGLFDDTIKELESISNKLKSKDRLKQKELQALISKKNEILQNLRYEGRKIPELRKITTGTTDPYYNTSSENEGSYQERGRQIGTEIPKYLPDEREEIRSLLPINFKIIKIIAILLVGILLLIGLYKGGMFIKNEILSTFHISIDREQKTFGDYEDKKESLSQIDDDNNEEKEYNKVEEDGKLIPEPNASLGQKDIERMVERQFRDNLPMDIEEVVNRIFKANPSDIGRPYKGKEKEYGELLIEKNRHIFSENRMTDAHFKEVPIYKEQR